MITLKENYKDTRGNTIAEITHIFAENGHFERDGRKQGWHIQLGTNDAVENYTEVIDEGVSRSVPDSFEDVIISDEELEGLEEDER